MVGWSVAALLVSACRDDGGDGPTQADSTGAATTAPVDGTGSSGAPTGTTQDDGSSAGETELPSPYSDGTTAAGDQPSAGSEEVAAAIGAGLFAFLYASPVEIITAYSGIAVLEPDCPEQQQIVDGEFVDVIQWSSEGCTTSAGVTFTGVGRLEVATALVEGDRTIERGTLSSEGSTLRIDTDDGRHFELSGYFQYERGTTADAIDGYFGFTGDIEADPATAGSNLILTGELRPQGAIYAYSGDGYRGIGGDGSITGTALEGVVALSFAGVVIADQPCATEPAGQFAVRDDAGFWHDVVFDAATLVDDEYEWTGECDGCGAYVAGGTPSGEACIEADAMTALLGWEGFPW